MRFSNTLALCSTLIAYGTASPLISTDNSNNEVSKRAAELPRAASTAPWRPKTITWEELKAKVANSKPDPSQIHAKPNKEFSTLAGPCGTPATRVEWHNLDDGQRDAYISAVQCLMNAPSGNSDQFPGSRNRFEDFASLHQQLRDSIHEVGAFLPWHRYYLHVFEQVLREECGYGGPMTWWDESVDSGNFANSLIFNSRWFGPLYFDDGCVTETGFGAYQPNLGPNEDINNPRCLFRGADEGSSGNTNADWVNGCMGSQNYDDYRSCSEFGVHAYGHIGVGGIMANVPPAPEDPVFVMHHGFIDRNYRMWENGDHDNRINQVGGPAPGGGTTQPGDVLTSLGIRPDATIGDVLDTEGGYLCYVYDKE